MFFKEATIGAAQACQRRNNEKKQRTSKCHEPLRLLYASCGSYIRQGEQGKSQFTQELLLGAKWRKELLRIEFGIGHGNLGGFATTA